jgi:hypothetical protein
MAISIEYRVAKNAGSLSIRIEPDVEVIAALTVGSDITKRKKTPFNENAGADKTHGR